MANYKKKGNAGKTIALVVALVLTMGAAGTSLAMGISQNDWFKSEPQTEQPADDTQNDGEQAYGGAVIGQMVSSGMRLMSTALTADEYEEYGVSPLAENAYTLTATITPANAANKAVTWTVAWKNASSTWATGKTVTDYVTVTPTSDGALTATVSCLQAFGEQVVITVTSQENANVKASCTVDYASRIINTVYSGMANGDDGLYDPMGGVVGDNILFGVPVDVGVSNFQCLYTRSAYTVNEAYSATLTITVNETVLSQINEKTGLSIKGETLTQDGSDHSGMISFGGVTFLNLLTGVDWSNAANFNKLATAVSELSPAALFEFDMTIVGQYSTWTEHYKVQNIKYNQRVESVSLDQSSMII